MKYLSQMLILMILLLVSAIPALAQGIAPDPGATVEARLEPPAADLDPTREAGGSPAPPEVILPVDVFIEDDSPAGELANALLIAIQSLVYVPAAASFVVVLTAILKRPLKTTPSRFIALGVMMVMWLFYSAAQAVGYEEQVTQLLDALTQIGYILLGGTVTSIGAAKLYEQSAKHHIPVLGHVRQAEYPQSAEG